MTPLHEKACENFNEMAEELLSGVGPPPKTPKSPSTFEPDFPVAGSINLTSHEGLRMSYGEGDAETGRFFATEDGLRGLSGEGFIRFKQIAARVSSRSELREVLSTSTAQNILFEWLRVRFEDESQTPFATYLEEEVEARVKTFEFWIPIATLYLESPLELGRIHFQPITSHHIDEWTSKWEERAPEESKAGIAGLRKRWGSIQGLAAARISVTGEKELAQQHAFEQAEEAVSMLRLFSSEILSPTSWSLCSVEGLESLGGSMLVVLRDGALDSVHRSLPAGLNYEWRISDELKQEIWSPGLQDAHELLTEDDPSDFQKYLLKALQHYSMAALKRDPAEKLLYVVTALDSMLSGGPQEGQVVQNFRERFALIRASDLNGRMAVAERATKIYTQRSRYVHGAVRPDDLEIVKEFLFDAWLVFQQLLTNHRFFADKKQFLKTLDAHKMAGPPVGKLRASE